LIFGKYQLLELLGRGGMAEVFKAKSYGVEGFEKLLVIKRILSNLTNNERFVEMFINEAKIAVSLNHANIVQVFDLGKVGDSYYIAMEFVQGMDLSAAVKSLGHLNRSMPPELAAFIGSEIAKGLDFAHRRRDQNLQPLNIVHRDISPHNILLSFEGEVKITDFGIAKAKSSLSDFDEGLIKGKYAYMAPEQAQAKPVDRRADIFSLGVLMYEALSGTNPLRGGGATDIIRRAELREYPALDEIKGFEHIGKELSDIVWKCMAPDMGKRYSDAGELYESLISFLYGTGKRVGAHTLAAFLSELVAESVAPESMSHGEARLMAAFFSSASTSPTGSGSDIADFENSDITSIQVPTSALASASTSFSGGDQDITTGARSLAAELRDVTVLALEFVGPPMPGSMLVKLRSVIELDGGTVRDERSDLMVALFGLQIADGRDTQDAIACALKLQRITANWSENTALPQMGAGVLPDKIVLAASGTPREDDVYFAAVSRTRELARRGVGQVITSKEGRDLSATLFHFDSISITSSAGAETTVFNILSQRPVAESYGRLFGRKSVLRSIGEILAFVSRGSGRVLVLVGDAGTGKTRIAHEVQRRLSSDEYNVGWYEAPCVPWRHSMPFAAVGRMFRSILGIGEIEQEAELRRQVERLRELGLIPEEIEAVSGLLGLTTERPAGPEERSRQLRAALIRAASSLASDRMTILFWDDLAYIDKESLDILRQLCRSASHLPLLVLLAHRTSFDLGWDDDKGHVVVELGPLSETDSKRLSLSRMEARRAPEDLLIDVALKSMGNPLYIEEYVKLLLSSGAVRVVAGEAIYNPMVSQGDLPKTLRGLVGARIKSLPPEQRGLMQRAAVMGHRFNIDLLAAITGLDLGELRPQLQGLKEAGLLQRLSTYEYAFSSDLVRDVVYDGIVFSDRREIHATVGRAIEDIFPERLDEFVERLAVHFREGGERKKAVDYLIRAGDKVAAEFSFQAALDYYIKALDLLQNVPRPDLDRILSVYLPVGRLAVKTNNLKLGLEKMRLAEELADEIGDLGRLVQIMQLSAELHARADRYQESQQYFQRAIELSDELGDNTLRAEVRATAGHVYFRNGDLKKAAPYYRESIEIIKTAAPVQPNLLVSSMAQLAKAETVHEHEAAQSTIAEAEKFLSAVTNPTTRCEFEQAKGWYYNMTGDIERAITHHSRSLDIAREYDLKDLVAKDAHNIGDAYLALGDYRKAYTFLRMSQEVAEAIEHEMLINLNTIFLSFIDALKFGSNEGLSALKKALEVASERNTVWEQLQVHYFLGRIYFERDEFLDARKHLEQSIRIGRAADNKIYDAQAVDLLEQICELENDQVIHQPCLDNPEI
jgi:serine/threonine protein kinase/predicted ATPase